MVSRKNGTWLFNGISPPTDSLATALETERDIWDTELDRLSPFMGNHQELYAGHRSLRHSARVGCNSYGERLPVPIEDYHYPLQFVRKRCLRSLPQWLLHHLLACILPGNISAASGKNFMSFGQQLSQLSRKSAALSR